MTENKKILFVSTPSSTFFSPMRRAFEYHGFKIYDIDYQDNFLLNPGNIIHRFFKRLPRRLFLTLRELAQGMVDKRILAMAEKTKPDLIFVVKAQGISGRVLDPLKKVSTTINFYPETMDQWELIKKVASRYSYFVNYDPYVVEMLKKEGYGNVFYVPFSADLNEDDQWPKQDEYLYDISFIGTFDPEFYSERENILREIKDLGLFVWGNKAWMNTSLRDSYQGRAKTEEIQRIYRNSKIVINIDISNKIPGTGVNLRPFEVTAAGAMLLNHDGRKDIFNLFEDGKEFISFSDADDLRNKVKYYLKNEDERLKIAKAGFERAKKEHSYIKRMGEIIQKCV